MGGERVHHLSLRVLLVAVVLEHAVLRLPHPGGRRKHLGYGLVHGIRHGCHSGSHVRDLRQLHEPLDVSILSVCAVEHRDHAVDVLRLRPVFAVKNKKTVHHRIVREDHLTVFRVFFPAAVGDGLISCLRHVPSAFLCYADSAHVVLVLVQSLQHVYSRVPRYLVLR